MQVRDRVFTPRETTRLHVPVCDLLVVAVKDGVPEEERDTELVMVTVYCVVNVAATQHAVVGRHMHVSTQRFSEPWGLARGRT